MRKTITSALADVPGPPVPLMKPLPTWIDDRSREQLLDLGREIADHVPGAEVALDHRRVDQTSRIRRQPGRSRTSPQSFRDRVLHIPVMITTTGGRVRIQLDATICYAITVAACGWTRLRHALT